MLLNLASDKPFIFSCWDFVFFDRKNLENQLPEFFKNKNINEIYVITWPGYFSSTRIWVEVVNILKFLWILNKVFFLSKIDLFTQFLKIRNLDKIYIFSGNKNKFIELSKEWKFSEILKKNINLDLYVEELFEISLKNKFVLYKDILKDYKKNFSWNIANKYLVPFYIFEPLVQKKC